MEQIKKAEQDAKQEVENAKHAADQRVHEASVKAEALIANLEDTLSRDLESIALSEEKQTKSRIHKIESDGKAELKAVTSISDVKRASAAKQIVKSLVRVLHGRR